MIFLKLVTLLDNYNLAYAKHYHDGHHIDFVSVLTVLLLH